MKYKEMLSKLCDFCNLQFNQYIELTDEFKNHEIYVAKYWKQGDAIAEFNYGLDKKIEIPEDVCSVRIVCLDSLEYIRDFPGTIEELIRMQFNGDIDYETELIFVGTFEEYKEWSEQ